MTFFLRHYVANFESNVDLAYIASNEMDNRSLVTLCKYLYDRDKYVAFSSTHKYKIFLRKINKAVEEIYLETLNELLIFYDANK